LSALELSIVVLSALLHAAWSVAIKGSRDPLAFNLLQLIPQALVALALALWIDFGEIPMRVWWTLAATGVAHGLYFYWMSRAYELADLSMVYPIARSTPAFLPLVAIPLLGESISLLGALGIATVVAGMWLVHLGNGVRWRDLLKRGTAYAYLTLASTVAYSLLDKKAMADLHAADWSSPVPRAIFYYFALTIACSFVFVPLTLRRLSAGALAELARSQWKAVAGAVVFTVASYGLILEALRTAPSSYVVAARQVSVLFVLAMSVIWLGERPGPTRALGGALTVVGVVLLGVAR
jgi:drug/metabolite transporter (DMT)-like permease